MSHETNSIVKPHLPKSDFVVCLILITCSHTFISKSKSSEDKSNRFAVTYHNSKGHQHNQLLVFFSTSLQVVQLNRTINKVKVNAGNNTQLYNLQGYQFIS